MKILSKSNVPLYIVSDGKKWNPIFFFHTVNSFPTDQVFILPSRKFWHIPLLKTKWRLSFPISFWLRSLGVRTRLRWMRFTGYAIQVATTRLVWLSSQPNQSVVRQRFSSDEYGSDPCSYEHYVSSSKNKAWKRFRPVRDLNPWPVQYRCSALPTELTGTGRYVGSK